MNNNIKDQLGRDIVCRSHSARSERDIYRVCPSKLNKKELEDLYFSLLENNFELKRTINGQRDKIKMLTTKVQRMTAAQKGNFSRESRECCLTTKAVVNEQKEIIVDLKKSNERMSERIRLLNMRLCSAKQFVKRSPTQSTTHCLKCSTQTAKSLKNSSSIALNTSISETNLKNAAVSCHNLIEKNMQSTRSVQTETNEECKRDDSEKQCNENKCRTLMEELKQKIVNLQEELSSTHSEYSSRIGRLEMEMCSLQARDKDTQNIAARLTRAEVRNGELAMELSIERGKVAELEASVKAAQMSSKVAAAIEGHLAHINQARPESYSRPIPLCSSPCPAEWEERTSRLQIQQSTPTKAVNSIDFKLDSSDIKPMKHSDDSGYTEANKSSEVSDSLNRLNQELMKKILELQTKLDLLQVSGTSEIVVNGKTTETLINIEDTVIDKSDERISIDVKDQGCVFTEPDKDVIVEPQMNNTDIKTNGLNKQQSTTNVSPGIDKISSTSGSTSKHPLVWMTDGQKSQENTDDDSYTIKPGEKPPAPEIELKYDHNKYQIPGPIALDTDKSTKNDRRRSFGVSINKTKENWKSIDDVTVVKENDSERKCTVGKGYEEDKTENLKHVSDLHEDNAAVKFVNGKLKKDSLKISRQRLEKKSSKPVKESIPAIVEKKINENEQEHTLTNYNIGPAKSNHLLNIEQHRTVPKRKDIQLGTQADYQVAVEPCPLYKRSTMDVDATYSVEEKGHDSRGSDKDTDHEISAMSDLPTEREDKSPARVLSPGEKGPSTSTGLGTSTRTYSAPTDAGTLSEGELPTVGRARKLSIGERPTNDVMPGGRRRSSPQKMEEALHAVKEELARCKQMLLHQRQQQVNYVPTFT